MGVTAYSLQESRRRSPSYYRAINRAKGESARSTAKRLALANITNKETAAALLAVGDDIQYKAIQNAIKTVLSEARRGWRAEIKGAKTSGRRTSFQRRYGGIGLRSALAKSIRIRNPKGKSLQANTGWLVLAGGSTKHGKRGEAVTNAGQAAWLEFGTDQHALRPTGKPHPGTKPLMDFTSRLRRMEGRTRALFERAISTGIATGGKRMSTKSARAFMEGTR